MIVCGASGGHDRGNAPFHFVNEARSEVCRLCNFARPANGLPQDKDLPDVLASECCIAHPTDRFSLMHGIAVLTRGMALLMQQTLETRASKWVSMCKLNWIAWVNLCALCLQSGSYCIDVKTWYMVWWICAHRSSFSVNWCFACRSSMANRCLCFHSSAAANTSGLFDR